MRRFLIATAIMAVPAIAAAEPHCAITKPMEPFIKLPAPVEVTGRPVPLQPTAAVRSAGGPNVPPVPPAVQVQEAPVLPTREASGDLKAIPVLRHIADAGAALEDLGSSHGLRTVAARNTSEFMVFQVVPDGQVAVAGLMTDLSLNQLKKLSGSTLTELDSQHGLRTFFLRSGGRFQVFYATADGERIIPGVMWDAAGQDVTRKAIASIPGVTPTVTIGAGARDAQISPVLDTTVSGARSVTDTVAGSSGSPTAPDLWMFVDANCSFSIRAIQQLQPFVAAGRVHLHLVPLSILDGEDNGLSTQHALGLVSTSPDQMLPAWESSRYPDNPRPDAAPKLATNMAVAAANQIRGTPTFFWRKPDGSQGRFDGVPNDINALVASLGG